MKKTLASTVAAMAVCLFCAGCVTTTPPPSLSYVSVDRPNGVIKNNGQPVVQKEFSRGGWYVGNHNFRPAPDVAAYLKDAAGPAAGGTLRNADVQLTVPFAFDILFFGFNKGTDRVIAQEK